MDKYYEINVALNGVHFFATAPRSLPDMGSLLSMYAIFKSKFPESDGFEVTASYNDCGVSTPRDMSIYEIFLSIGGGVRKVSSPSFEEKYKTTYKAIC
jgi:hypothetical protein